MKKIVTLTFLFATCLCFSLEAQVVESFDYATGSSIDGQGNAGNGWAGAWKQVSGDPITIAVGGINSNELGVSSDNNKLTFSHTSANGNQRFYRGLTNPVEDNGQLVWLSFFMQTNWNDGAGGSVNYVMLVDTVTLGGAGAGGQLVQFGRTFGDPNFGIAKGGSAVRTVDKPAREASFVVVAIQMSGDMNADTAYMWVNPDPNSASLDLSTADLKTGNYPLNNGFNGIGMKMEGGNFIEGQIDEIRLGSSYTEVVSPNLRPASATENFNYASGSTLIAASTTENGWGGPWAQLDGPDPAITDGGMANQTLLKETSGNSLTIEYDVNPKTRIERPLSRNFADDGSTYYVSFTMNNMVTDNRTVSYLMLIDTAQYAQSGGNGQLVQIGKPLDNGNIGVGVGGTNNFELTSALADNTNFIVAKIQMSGNSDPDTVSLYINPTGTDEPMMADAVKLIGTNLNNGFNGIGIKVEGVNTGITSQFDDIYVGFDFATVIPSDRVDITNPIQAFAYDQFSYTVGNELTGQGLATNGWAGPWENLETPDSSTVVNRGIVNNDLNVRSSGQSAVVIAPGSNNRLQRLFETPIDTIGGDFWFSVQMGIDGVLGGNVGNITLVDTAVGGNNFQQIFIGKQFGNNNLFAAGFGASGGTQTGVQFTPGVGHWVVGHMTRPTDSTSWELDVWVNPDPTSEPLEVDANIVNKKYNTNVINGVLLKAEGAAGIEFLVDDLYFGNTFTEVVPLDLIPITPLPGPVVENFNDYNPGDNLVGANGGSGFTGPYELVNDNDQTIAAGGMTNFFLLKETSGNRLSVPPGNNARIVRPIQEGYGDDGRTFWLSWHYIARNGGPNVAHLVLADKDTYGPTGAGGQLAQIGKGFNTGIQIVSASGGTVPSVAADTTHFYMAKIVTNGTSENDQIYLWVDPSLDDEPSVDTANLVAGVNLSNWNALGFKIEGDPGVEPEWDDIYLGNSWVEVIPTDLTDVLPPEIPRPAFDIFDYTVGEDLDSQNGGEGWRDAWMQTSGTATIEAGAINSNRVNPEGNKVTINQSTDPVSYSRMFFNPFGKDRSQVWFSFLLDVTQKDIGNGGGVSLANAGTSLITVGGTPGISQYNVTYNGGTQTATASPVVGTNWVVMRLDMDGTAAVDTALIWLNPPSDAIPSDDNALFNITDVDLSTGFDEVQIGASGAQTMNLSVDAVRIGFTYRDISNQFGSDDPDLLAYEPFNYDVGADLIGAGGLNAFWEGAWFDKGILADNLATIESGNLSVEDGIEVGNKGQLNYVSPGTQLRVDRELAFPMVNDGRTYWVSFLQFTEPTVAVNNVGNITLRNSGITDRDGQRIAFGRIFGTGNIGFITPPSNNAREGTVPDEGLNWLVVRIKTSGNADADTLSMWVNPDPIVEPDTSSAEFKEIPITVLKDGIDIIRLKAEGVNGNETPYVTQFDEVRLTTAWQSAVPIVNSIKPVEQDPFVTQAYPNPSNGLMTLEFELQKSGPLQVDMFDISGKHIRSLVNETASAGKQQYQLDLRTDVNGIYFLRIVQNGQAVTRKLILYK